MVQVGLKNPILIITPVSQEEINEGFRYGKLYVLYKDKNDKIEIGILDMVKFFPKTANMFGFDEAKEKAFFCNADSKLLEVASTINDRPIYSIQPSDDRKVETCNIINNVDIELSDVLNGNFKVAKKNKQAKHM